MARIVDRTRPAREETLEACVARILKKEGVPAFCEHVTAIMAQTLDVESNFSELARTILRDLGITSEILRVANSALYNRSGRPMLSVAHAITLLGWDTVRNILSAIRYVDHFVDASPGLRELMLLSVLNAVHSRELAVSIGLRNPEEAYVCGLFRNLGEVLVACHCPHEYSQIILAMHEEKISARAACLRYLDFSWDDIGAQIAKAWNMPSEVQLCLAGAAGRFSSTADASMSSLVDYARDLTHALHRTGAGIESFRLRCISRPEGRPAPVPARELTRIAESAVQETGRVFAGLSIPFEKLRLKRQAERARHILESTPVFDFGVLRELDEAIAAARRTVERGQFELSSVITSILEAIHNAGFDSAVFGLVNEKHTLIRGRLASGPRGAEILSRFQFALDQAEGTVLTALVHQTDLLIDRSRDNRYDGSAIVHAFEPRAFALFPVASNGKPVGCIYADRIGASPGLSSVHLSLGRARDVIAAAIRLKAAR